MLKHLHIANYALINRLDIDFSQGFSVITGETGAGKSIILGALNLLSGQRADTRAVQDGSGKCIIEAVFDVAKYDLLHLFADLDIEYADECIMRREISPSGKSRAFVNDSPVQLNVMREVASRLFDIHSQHQNLLISDSAFMLDFVDAVAGNGDIKCEYRNRYEAYVNAIREYETLIKAAKSNDDVDYLRYQLAQLAGAKLRDGEQEALEEEQNVLTHAEEIKTDLYTISRIFDNDDGGLLTELKKIVNTAASLQNLYQQIEPIHSRLENSYLELKDIAYDVSGMADDMTYDHDRLQAVNERLDLIYSLQQKFRVHTVSDLIDKAKDFEDRLAMIENYDDQKAQISARIDATRSEAIRAANDLSASRVAVFSSINASIIAVLHSLGMPSACVELATRPKAELMPDGLDEITMLFTANKNRSMQDVAGVASGGELARLMLAIKSVTCRLKVLPTIIFDEIDTGVSGEIAAKMGDMMKQMGERMQVISITHLPQIAAKGAVQYKVYKHDNDGQTTTNIKLLSSGERVEELAMMLSGNKITDAAINNAKELLKDE